MASFDRFEHVELAAVQDGAVFMMMICRTVDFNRLFCSRQFKLFITTTLQQPITLGRCCVQIAVSTAWPACTSSKLSILSPSPSFLAQVASRCGQAMATRQAWYK
ncbi:hypothetical protein D917_02395 [Trichinella nativa]|uniref:Uncharacterized protein n=1 Tax=Trichinella nativa TaxID=6335 RepID=A0A1Y3EFX9_9BILA|nr:hypothetical protein D917_02395 [Trichinella nativa]